MERGVVGSVGSVCAVHTACRVACWMHPLEALRACAGNMVVAWQVQAGAREVQQLLLRGPSELAFDQRGEPALCNRHCQIAILGGFNGPHLIPLCNLSAALLLEAHEHPLQPHLLRAGRHVQLAERGNHGAVPAVEEADALLCGRHDGGFRAAAAQRNSCAQAQRLRALSLEHGARGHVLLQSSGVGEVAANGVEERTALQLELRVRSDLLVEPEGQLL